MSKIINFKDKKSVDILARLVVKFDTLELLKENLTELIAVYSDYLSEIISKEEQQNIRAALGR